EGLSSLWGSLGRSDVQPPSDQAKQRQFENSLAGSEGLHSAYAGWDNLPDAQRKAALQETSDQFSRIYGIEPAPLSFKDTGNALTGHFRPGGSIVVNTRTW